MCGIAGILDHNGVDGAAVQSMAEALAHRGPDEAAIHVEDVFGFGFRRLSIIDLATGSQPIANESGDVIVVNNGEIYNYLEIRRDLERHGHRFSTRSDTEVLVHLYEERGPELVREIRGMFAFAIWDRTRRRLLLARDHLGQKPLYWAREGERVWFASEIKAILAAAPQFRELNEHALHEYLALRLISAPRSMFSGIHKLPAAHHMIVHETAEPVQRRYWNLRYEPKKKLGAREAVARLDAELRETVRLHLVSDVEVGAFLSGGIDSGLITGVIRSITSAPLKTFSIGTPYGRFDESPTARAVARRYGTEHKERAVTGDLVGLLPVVVAHMDEPSDPLSVCMFALSQLASEYVKVAIGGDGGDELFGGYDRYYAVPWVEAYARLPKSMRDFITKRLLDAAPDGMWYKSLANRLRWLDELAGEAANRRYARGLSYFYFTPSYRDALYTPDFERSTADFDAEESICRWLDDDAAFQFLDRMLLADSMVRLPDHSVMILDRMSMAHGLEVRSPFLDHRLAEFAATLPVRLKIKGHRRRYIETRLAERYLPPEVLKRPKQGLSSALPYMMARQFRALFEHYLPDSYLVSAGYLRRPAIERLLSEHLSRRLDHGNRLWLLLNAEIWCQLHLERREMQDLSEEFAAVLGPGR